VEVRKGLGFVSEGSKFLNQLSVVFNGSYIQSEVKVDPNDLSQIENRPLQGQSPYIINGGIFWENEASGWQINALYNVFGNRIFAVGDRQGNLANNPTIFERPRNVIDLSITKKFGKSFEAKFGISDILNQPVRFFQDFNLNKVWNEGVDNEYFRFRPGQVYSLSLTYKIF
jgi:outer membrane receptor protein involved in Fe transport